MACKGFLYCHSFWPKLNIVIIAQVPTQQSDRPLTSIILTAQASLGGLFGYSPADASMSG